MITCPKCSAQNDPSNRFCDQCGFRLEGVAETPAAAAPTPAAAPVAAAEAAPAAAPTMNCPSCGAAVLPGEAFCDVCGASLQGLSAAVDADAPTVLAPAAPSGTPMTGVTVTNPNDAPTTDAPTVPPPSGAGVTPAAVDAAAPPAPATNDPEPATSPPTPAAAPAPADAQGTDAQNTDPERQRLEELIATQDKLIAQMEQMQSMFGAATPPAILDGLKQARDTKAKAEADLQALPQPKPPVDPAEVARLEELIATQDKLIAQMEQMQSMFGAATPPAILDGLKQARDTKATAEADLQALIGGTAPAPSAPTPSPTPPPTPPTPSAPQQEAAPVVPPVTSQTPPPPDPVPVVPPPTPAPVPSSAPAPGPRLVVVEGGKELPLPLDKAEVIIGREDPISQIFPEIDLTPFGGETGGVSRQHARMTHTNGQWMVTDLNSTNYTRVDGVKIDPQVPVAVRDGSRIQFGRIATVFHA